MPAPAAPDRWPFAPGEAAACIRALTGDGTPLGPSSQWSAALRTTIDLMLPSQAEIVLFWGPQFVAFYNDTYAPTIGAKHPGAMGRPAREHWAELWDDLHPLLERVLTLGETVSAKDRPFQINRHGHMEEVFFDISYSPVRESDGSVGGVLCIVSETTARVKATRQLAASEEHLRELHEQWRLAQAAGGVGVFVLDIQRDTLTASPGFCRIFGLPEQELHAPADVERLRTDSADGDPVSTRESRSRGTAPLDVEYPIRRADDGALRWIWRRAEIVRDALGQPLLMRGVVQDVTERHEARLALAQLNASLEQRVQERTRELNRIWSLSADLMISVRLDGRIVSVNPAWTQVLGWPDEALVGTDVLALLHPEDVEPSRHALGQLAQGQRLLRYENRFRHHDGSYRSFSWTAVPDTSGQIHAVGRDVTALRESEQRLRHSQKMEAIGQLTGGIAHDFNNMLQGITGAIEVMRRRVAAGRTSDLERFMESASQSAQRAASLVQRLLAFSRRQSLDLKPVDVNALIASMEELMHRSLGEQVRLAVQLAPDARHALGDESQLESAILNLAINARDAMPGGGELRISTANVQLGEAELRAFEGVLPGDYLAIAVADSGTGMSADVLARAFDPFFTTKPIGQGTGLGLSMVYGFARQSRGLVQIDSTPGRGTTVTLCLPRAPEAAAPVTVREVAAVPQGDGEVVLVVEDDPGVRLLVREVLAELGYHALEAADGQAALPILQSQARIDLLVSDVGLPGLNGRQVAEIARQHREGLPVLFMTGYAEYATNRAEFLAPGMHMIGKPFAVDQLAHRIRALMHGPGDRAPGMPPAA